LRPGQSDEITSAELRMANKVLVDLVFFVLDRQEEGSGNIQMALVRLQTTQN